MRIKILLVILLSTGLISCKKWLDVKPATQLPEDEMFSNEQGFNDVMLGVYTRAAGRDLYGDKLTATFMDVIARRYNNTVTNTFHSYYYAAFHDYTASTVQDIISKIWSEMYAGIAQLNLLLEHVDNARSVFSSEAAYQRCKAQALGMRAFLHFDVLRMFAPAYVTDPAYKAIPYMKDFTVKPSESLTTTVVLDNCISDLKEAETLLEADTAVGNRYWFNSWTVKATLARIYLYRNDAANALAYAKQVIDGNAFRFVNTAEINSATPDRVFPTELIFSLSSFYLNMISDTYFTESANGASSPINIYLQAPEATINSIYENNVQGYGGDPRYKLWWQLPSGSTIRFLSKYWQIGTVNQYRMPVIRLAEMYLIAAEASPDVETAKAYLDAFRVNGRFLPPVTATTAAQVETEIAKEYVKEFFGEGQLFYYYKRKNITVPGAVATGDALFVFPVPQNEIEFRF